MKEILHLTLLDPILGLFYIVAHHAEGELGLVYLHPIDDEGIIGEQIPLCHFPNTKELIEDLQSVINEIPNPETK